MWREGSTRLRSCCSKVRHLTWQSLKRSDRGSGFISSELLVPNKAAIGAAYDGLTNEPVAERCNFSTQLAPNAHVGSPRHRAASGHQVDAPLTRPKSLHADSPVADPVGETALWT